MRKLKDILYTVLCVLVVLIPGYFLFFFLGDIFFADSKEPEEIVVEDNVAGLFYAKLEEKVEFYPWKYFVPLNQQEDRSYIGKNKINLDSKYLEDDIFQKLIAKATGIPLKKIQKKFSRKKRIFENNMIQGIKDHYPINIYFYRKSFWEDGQKYRVKISCDDKSIISFSCLPVRENSMTLEEGFHEKKEEFLQELDNQPQRILEAFQQVYNFFYSAAREQEDLKISNPMEQKKNIRVIELKNNLLLVMEGDITVGLYYDVLSQKIAGFHFFYE